MIAGSLWWMLPLFLLLASVVVPAGWADRRACRLRKAITFLSGTHLIAAGVLLAAVLQGAVLRETLLQLPGYGTPALNLYLDGVSGLMLVLVAFIGWVICGYSVRYLDGEPRQGRYFRWLALTVGAVSLLAVAGDLLTLFVAWSLSSLGIHQLLTHYRERPAARRAAWTKFAISRAGDVFLVAAGVLIYRQWGTLEFAELFSLVQSSMLSAMPAGPGGAADSVAGVPGMKLAGAALLPLIGGLLVTGAALKTAQFPFHFWLPDTLEAPTPVSALMHAGIVNAGGYVLIRLSPLLAEASWALMSLAMLGAFTAVFGALVMLTQTSIKRSLAWSTIAQMGFMMLQCGLGAFSAAMLHLIAHSLYKAHAFLNSGDVLNQASAMKATRSPGASLSPVPALSPSLPLSGNPAGRSAGAGSSSSGTAATEFPPRSLGWTAMATVSIYAGVCALTGLDPAAKSGGFLLGFLLCLGLTRWVWQSTWTRRSLELATALVVTGVLCGIYAVSFLSVDSVVASSFGPFSASAHSSPAALAAEHTLAGIVPGFGAGDSAGANGGAGLASGIWLLIAGSFTATGFVTLFLLESWLCLCPGGSARRSHPRPSSPHAPADASASTPGSSASMPRSNASMPSWPPWLQAAYVHASNGFYVDAVLHRSLRAVTSREPFPRNASVSVVSRISRKGTVQ